MRSAAGTALVSSSANTAAELRAPHDVANLATLFGLSAGAGKASVCTVPEAVLEQARRRRRPKGFVTIISAATDTGDRADVLQWPAAASAKGAVEAVEFSTARCGNHESHPGAQLVQPAQALGDVPVAEAPLQCEPQHGSTDWRPREDEAAQHDGGGDRSGSGGACFDDGQHKVRQSATATTDEAMDLEPGTAQAVDEAMGPEPATEAADVAMGLEHHTRDDLLPPQACATAGEKHSEQGNAGKVVSEDVGPQQPLQPLGWHLSNDTAPADRS